MILFYTLLMLLLDAIKSIVNWRARSLERKFVRTTAAVEQMLREPAVKPGNSNKLDACVVAKKTLALGQLAHERDRVESAYFAWQRWADRWTRWSESLGAWKGKKLPYTLGAVDVWMLFGLIDYFGVGEYVSVKTLIDSALALWVN